MELRQYLALARNWWWLLLLLAMAGGGVAFGVGLLTPPEYETSTTILINQARGSLPDAEAVLSGQRVAATYAELIHQRPVLEEVIKQLNLQTDPQTLDRQVRVSPVRDTNLLALTVRDSDPYRAANIANALVEVFIRQNVETQTSRYAASLTDLQAQLDDLQQEIDATEKRLKELENQFTPTATSERERLQTLLIEDRRSFSTLTQSFEEIRLAQAQTTDKITVVESALPGISTSSVPRNVAVGGLAGLMLAAGLVVLFEYLRETVKTDEEVERLIGAPTLGVIGQIPGSERSGVLITAYKPRAPISEAYRVLRANIEFSGQDKPLKTLVITSSSPAEGKTTTTANLAIATAQFGKQVILVDADMRRPTLHKLFNQHNTRGLSTALMQEGGGYVQDHMVATGVENLWLMTSGPLPPNPSDVLGSRRMAELIERLKSQADMILFDSPPLLAVADSSLLSRVCDATVLVALSNSTRGDALRRSKEQLDQSGATLLGVVLNRVATSRDGYYYYYHRYYSSDQS